MWKNVWKTVQSHVAKCDSDVIANLYPLVSTVYLLPALFYEGLFPHNKCFWFLTNHFKILMH